MAMGDIHTILSKVLPSPIVGSDRGERRTPAGACMSVCMRARVRRACAWDGDQLNRDHARTLALAALA